MDFSTYSLNELYSSAESIDRAKYPDRAKELDALIQEKEEDGAKHVDHAKDIGEKSTISDRIWAELIDTAVFLVVSIPPLMYFDITTLKLPILLVAISGMVYGLAVTLALQGYLLYCYGQTIGKSVMSIRIENLDGTKASFKKIVFLRIFPMRLCLVAPVIGPFIACFFDPVLIFGKERRCLHDYIAKTKVCYTAI